MTERELSVSSVIAGVRQDIESVYKVFNFLEKRPNLELLAAYRVSDIRARIDLAKQLGAKEVTLHGRTHSNGSSGKDKILARLIDSLWLRSTQTLLDNFTGQDDHNNELLVHQTEADQPRVFEAIVRKKPKNLLIENDHPLPGQNPLNAVDAAVDTALRFREKDVNCDFVLDVCHALGVKVLEDGFLRVAWDKLVIHLNDNVVHVKSDDGKPIWRGTHFPVGTETIDSLPINNKHKLSDLMLRDFSELQNISGVEKFIIEAALCGLSKYFGIMPWEFDEIQKRMHDAHERIVKNNLI